MFVPTLPPLMTADGIEFDKTRVVLDAYRQTYAQRHTDAGVPIDLLAELMDHRKLDTTSGYYNCATAISLPRCAACGRELSTMQCRGDDWYCSPCFRRPQPCSSCGRERPVTFRDRHGRPRCSGCPDRGGRDPRQVLAEIIAAADPGLSTDAVAAALAATVVRPADMQKLAWVLENAPELLTGYGGQGALPDGAQPHRCVCDAGATASFGPPARAAAARSF